MPPDVFGPDEDAEADAGAFAPPTEPLLTIVLAECVDDAAITLLEAVCAAETATGGTDCDDDARVPAEAVPEAVADGGREELVDEHAEEY